MHEAPNSAVEDGVALENARVSAERHPSVSGWRSPASSCPKDGTCISMSDVNAKLDEASLYIERSRTLVKSIASFPYIAKSY